MTTIKAFKEQEMIRQDYVARRLPTVSIVVPAYNEAAIIKENLTILCDYMTTLEDRYLWEMVVVNDGSSDNTGDLIEEFAVDKRNVKILHHMYNFRLGQALRYAFKNCSGDYIVVMDSDLSYSPDHIERMLEKIREARAKIVIASPYMKEGKVTNVPTLRKLLSVWANRFIAFFARDRFQSKLTTITGMVRAYDRKFLSRLNLKAMDTDINPEIIYKAMILRARIVEVPAHLNWSNNKEKDNNKGKRVSSARITRNILSSVLSGFLFRPFMFFILPGLALLILSLYPLGWALIHTITSYEYVYIEGMQKYFFSEAIARAYSISPHSFIVGGITLILSIQIISLGIIALQNKKYFEELFHLQSNSSF